MVSGTDALSLEAEDDPDVHAVSVQAVNNMYIMRLIGWYRKKVPFFLPMSKNCCTFAPAKVFGKKKVGSIKGTFFWYHPNFFWKQTGIKKAQPFDCALARWANSPVIPFYVSDLTVLYHFSLKLVPIGQKKVKKKQKTVATNVTTEIGGGSIKIRIAKEECDSCNRFLCCL